MGKAVFIDVCGLGAILLWICISILQAYWGNGPMFERLGAFGTATAVGYFALIRHSLPYPVGLHERLFWLQKTTNLQADSILIALNNGTRLAAILKSHIEQTGGIPDQVISNLAAIGQVKHELVKSMERADASGASMIETWDAKASWLMSQSLLADKVVSEVATRSGNLQAIVLVVATIQWGFGSLLFAEVSKC
jgi:hypothetical protein